MKKTLLLPVIALGLFLSSCSTVINNLNTPCQLTAEVLFNDLQAILIMEGFEIEVSNSNVGILRASIPETREPWSGMYITKTWTFQIADNDKSRIGSTGQASMPAGGAPIVTRIIATAKWHGETRNAFGGVVSSSDKYYDDTVHKEYTWYWNIRNKLEDLCGHTIEIQSKESNNY